MFDGGVSLSDSFNAAQLGSGLVNTERFGSGQSNASSNAGQVSAGQISIVGLNPIPLAKKWAQIRQLILSGKLPAFKNISLETLEHELKKPEYDGLSADQMVLSLKEKKLLPTLKPPKPIFKLAALTPRMML